MNKTLTHDTIFPALRQVNFSSNAPPPRDVALRARLIIKNFTPNDSHSEEQKKAFHEFIRLNAHKLRILGDFAIGHCSVSSWITTITPIIHVRVAPVVPVSFSIDCKPYIIQVTSTSALLFKVLILIVS